MTAIAPPAKRPFLGLSVERRYRLIYKPAVFLAALAPLAWMVCGLFGWLGYSDGVDPVKFLELRCGKTALNFIMLTLMVTPVRGMRVAMFVILQIRAEHAGSAANPST